MLQRIFLLLIRRGGVPSGAAAFIISWRDVYILIKSKKTGMRTRLISGSPDQIFRLPGSGVGLVNCIQGDYSKNSHTDALPAPE
jgi:hypothetical protein